MAGLTYIDKLTGLSAFVIISIGRIFQITVSQNISIVVRRS